MWIHTLDGDLNSSWLGVVVMKNRIKCNNLLVPVFFVIDVHDMPHETSAVQQADALNTDCCHNLAQDGHTTWTNCIRTLKQYYF